MIVGTAISGNCSLGIVKYTYNPVSEIIAVNRYTVVLFSKHQRVIAKSFKVVIAMLND